MKHPNATTAGGTTGAGIVVVWALGHLGVDLSAELGAAIAGGASAAVLFIGREGLAGIARRIWNGQPNRP